MVMKGSIPKKETPPLVLARSSWRGDSSWWQNYLLRIGLRRWVKQNAVEVLPCAENSFAFVDSFMYFSNTQGAKKSKEQSTYSLGQFSNPLLLLYHPICELASTTFSMATHANLSNIEEAVTWLRPSCKAWNHWLTHANFYSWRSCECSLNPAAAAAAAGSASLTVSWCSISRMRRSKSIVTIHILWQLSKPLLLSTIHVCHGFDALAMRNSINWYMQTCQFLPLKKLRMLAKPCCFCLA